jgi:hypothetical protein
MKAAEATYSEGCLTAASSLVNELTTDDLLWISNALLSRAARSSAICKKARETTCTLN